MTLRVPMADLLSQYRPLRDEILAALTRVADSQRFIMGPETEALEDELRSMLGVEHAIGVSSGTDALLLALMALGVGPGDEVVMPAYSFFATAAAAVRLGATPVFVDIEPDSFNVDVTQIPAVLTSKTTALLPVHLFGLSADLDPILATASRASIPVVEDAAQAIGATCGLRKVGGIGVVGCFSFYPTKNLGAFGDAGLVTTNDAGLAARARLLRVHGTDATYVHRLVGGNFRIDALQAAILRVKAPHLSEWTEARRGNAARYRRMFHEAGLDGVVALPAEPSGRLHVFHQFVVRVHDRDDLKRHLDRRGIGNEIYYPVPLHLQPALASLGGRRGDFPRAERAAQESLAIPIHAGLSCEQQQMVVDAVAEFVRGPRGSS
jgi:dTDP-4-amino-4,6-dideoxygalactose transaminase